MLLRVLFLSLGLLSAFLATGQIVVPANGCVSENFDASNPWTFGGTNSSWTYDNPNKLHIVDDITGGGKCLILGGNTPNSTYNSNEDSWARSPVYDFSQITDPYLEFNFYWSNEASTSYDEIWMEYSTNGGASWQIVSPPAGNGGCYEQNWYNYPDNWGGNVGGCFSGTGAPSNWIVVRKCIASLGGVPQVEFRFRISTGTQCNNYGATVDNWTICDASINTNGFGQCTGNFGEYDFYDTSYPCPDQWSWDFGDGNSSNLQYPTHTYTVPGTYTVTLTSTSSSAITSGCGSHTGTHVFNLTVNDSVSVNYPASTYCTVDSPVQPTVTGPTGGTFSASPSGLSINPLNGEIMPSTSATGNYNITFNSSASCTVSSGATVAIASGPTVNPTPDDTVCHGELVSLPNFVSQPASSTTSWSLISGQDFGFGTVGTGNIPDFITNNTTNNAYTISFEVTPTSSSTCPGVPDTFDLIVGHLPTSTFVADTLYGCEPLSVTFIGQNTATACLWDFGNGTTSTACNSVSQTFDAGVYDISYSVTSQEGCSSTSIYSHYINAEATPEASFSYSPQLITTENSELTLVNTSTDSDQFSWEIMGSNGYYFSSTQENPVVQFPEDTSSYTICLTSMNTSGCLDSICKELTVLNVLSLFIPNTFSPNNDGINDFFGPVFSGIVPESYELIIFDRWGQIVFETDDIHTLWDGNQFGKPTPEGVYIWKLDYQEAGEIGTQLVRGHTNLIR